MGRRVPFVAADVEADIRLAVLPLENLTTDPELDVWGKLAADQMARAIDQPRPVPVVPSSTVAAAIRGMGDAATTESVAEAVKATHAFAGTVSAVGGQMRFEVELIDVRTGARLRTLDVISGPSSDADSLVATLAALSATVAVAHLDPGSPQWLAGATIPVSLAAFEAFLEQDEIFCTGDNAGSLGPGMRAVELSPGFASAIYTLMVAHNNLGNNFEADSLIDVLDGMRAEMTRQERLNLDWMIGNRTGDPDLSERAAAEAFRLDPVGAGVFTMLTAYRDLRMNDAIERLESADLDQACRWPGAWLQGSIAYHTLGRFDDELALARHGLGYYPRMRRMVEVAARSMAALGRVEAVDSLVNVMANLPPEERRDSNFRTFYTAMELGAHGFREEAARLMTDVLDGWVVNRPPLNDRYNHAQALYWGGRWEEAEALLADLTQDVPSSENYAGVHGTTLARLGRVAEARAVSARLESEPDPNGNNYWARGSIAAVLGERDEAVRLIRLGFDNGRNFNLRIHWDPTFEDMWGYGPWDALMAPR